MDVTTGTVVHSGFQQGFGLFLYMFSVHSGQRGQIELEGDMLVLQGLIIPLLHIFIPFRMCKQRVITFLLDALQDREQFHWWIEIGGFHQQVTFPLL